MEGRRRENQYFSLSTCLRGSAQLHIARLAFQMLIYSFSIVTEICDRISCTVCACGFPIDRQPQPERRSSYESAAKGACSRSHGVASCTTQAAEMEAFAPFGAERAKFSAICSNRGSEVLNPIECPYVYMMCCLVIKAYTTRIFRPYWPIILRPPYSKRRYGLSRP